MQEAAGKRSRVGDLCQLLQQKPNRSRDQELDPFLPAMVPLAEGPVLHSPGAYLAMLKLQSGQARSAVQPGTHAVASRPA